MLIGTKCECQVILCCVCLLLPLAFVCLYTKMDPDNIDSLTNSEIRNRLIALGQDVGPVTAKHRKLYLKKLKLLLLNNTKASSNNYDKYDPRNITHNTEDTTIDESQKRSRKSVLSSRKSRSPRKRKITYLFVYQ